MLMNTATPPEISYTQEELAVIEKDYNSLNLSNSAAIIEYGTDVQQKLSEVSGRMLILLNDQSMEDISTLLYTTVGYLQSMEEEKSKFSFFKSRRKLTLREKYKAAEKNVDRITDTLQEHQIQLMKNCAMLSQMHQMNDIYFKELNMKIAAGKKKLETCKKTELPALIKRANETGLVQDSQAVSNHQNQMERLEKKLHELELTASISLQSAPLIEMIQSNQTAMATKLQSTLLNTIPLWKNQVVLALGMEQAKQTAANNENANTLVHQLLHKNEESAKTASASTMLEASRNFTDVSSLDATNKQLIENLTNLNANET